MGMLINEMDKPKCDLLRLNTQLEGCFSAMKAGEVDLNVAIRTKRGRGKNQIFDTDSFVPEALKKRPTAAEKLTAAAKILVRSKNAVKASAKANK